MNRSISRCGRNYCAAVFPPAHRTQNFSCLFNASSVLFSFCCFSSFIHSRRSFAGLFLFFYSARKHVDKLKRTLLLLLACLFLYYYFYMWMNEMMVRERVSARRINFIICSLLKSLPEQSKWRALILNNVYFLFFSTLGVCQSIDFSLHTLMYCLEIFIFLNKVFVII